MSSSSAVNVRSEIREFLASRRARISPTTVGMPDLSRPRRVPGLRREEVAVLAGISAPYYARLERGDLVNASADVVDAIVRALRLDDSERSYLNDLASWNRRRSRRDDAESPQSAPERPQPRAALVNLLHAMTGVAGFICDDREEVLAANPLGYALGGPMFAHGRKVNFARYVFLDPSALPYFADSWPAAASKATSTLRTALGRYPGDSRLISLIRDLTGSSEQFCRFWKMHDVALRSSERRRLLHPVVGWIDLDFERLALPREPRLTLLTLGARPESRSASALSALGESAVPHRSPVEGDAPDR